MPSAVFAAIPAGEHVVHGVNCGHLPSVPIHHGEVTELDRGRSAPPLNLAMVLGEPYHVDACPLRPGDQLLLDTHGTTEMRDA
ncbi:SpoIIE family protein phosphatase [Streptomyces eurythermus]|uniref:SpoIIE family protein phosphatase n=1 Tax=Streptomyces eurythermus TaxID=42237 RepID=UPI0033F83B7F